MIIINKLIYLFVVFLEILPIKKEDKKLFVTNNLKNYIILVIGSKDIIRIIMPIYYIAIALPK